MRAHASMRVLPSHCSSGEVGYWGLCRAPYKEVRLPDSLRSTCQCCSTLHPGNTPHPSFLVPSLFVGVTHRVNIEREYCDLYNMRRLTDILATVRRYLQTVPLQHVPWIACRVHLVDSGVVEGWFGAPHTRKVPRFFCPAISGNSSSIAVLQ